MKVFHGSPSGDIEKFERRQANTGEHLPEQETRNAIYLTTDIGFALLAASRPRGEGGGVYKPESALDNQMSFRDPSKFDPEMEVFVYEWDLGNLPEGSYEVHGHQVIVDLDELEKNEISSHAASEVFEYYEFTNWPPPPAEHTSELKFR